MVTLCNAPHCLPRETPHVLHLTESWSAAINNGSYINQEMR